ncbi:hypothetical protein [Isoptericola sp. NPDC019482]|uniref:hypothetical protein n=1 Tax=Isoptericola sp. NPDC019482 TaxID=3154688 RepID=UPI003485A834
MSGRLGADPEDLRRLASAFERAGEGLEDDARQIGTKIRASGWDGPDARRYLSAWDSQHKPVLLSVGRELASSATTLRREAKAQEKASGEEGSGAGPGSGPGLGPRPGGDTDFFDVAEPAVGLAEFGGAAWKAFTYGRNLLNYTRALDGVGDAAASASVFTRQFMLEDGLGIVGRLGTFGKFAGVAGGAFSVIGGIDQMINPRYDGWRGGLDRVMGGVAVGGGVATIGMFLGAAAFTGPVGIGIAVGAGLVVGAYELTNLVVDNWDAITGFVSDPLPYLADGLDQVKDFAGDAADKVGEVASDVGGALKDGAGAVGDFVGGLFS